MSIYDRRLQWAKTENVTESFYHLELSKLIVHQHVIVQAIFSAPTSLEK